jgi:phenylalanyl-tRNA synthetase beta chain
MRVSHEWLSDFVELGDLAPARVAEQLTRSGTEVERIAEFGHGLEPVVVAEVAELEPIAGSSHLWLVRVSVPREPLAQVVCGAPNLSEGALVAWARPGTRLPGGMEIGQRRIRGLVSNGMLCAPDELGLGPDHEGVVLLPRGEVELGEPLSQVFPPDTVYELEVLSNRADCLCHWGVARELAAVFDRPLREPEVGPISRSGPPATESVEVSLEDPGDCPVYLAECLEPARPTATPLWLQRRLIAVGSRPISMVVDLSNYVMLELGQPLHTFDLDRLAGGRGRVVIGVRRGRAGEALRCLDSSVRQLEGALVITADDRPVALAGMIGGSETGVGEQTRQIVLEAANFNWVSIRRTTRRLGLRTDASSRFERSLSPALVPIASQRFLHLFERLAGGRVRPGPVLGGALPLPPEPIVVSSLRIGGLLGMEVPPEQAAATLRRLQFGVTVDGEALQVVPLAVRTDIRIPEDLTEEVGRVLGYELVPATLPPLRSAPRGDPGRTSAARLTGEICLGAGFTEAVSSSLVHRERLGPVLGLGEGVEATSLSNPLSSQLGGLRVSCVAGLLEACQLNQSRGQERTRLFEWGRAFWSREGGDGRPEEPELLAVVDHASGVEGRDSAGRLDRLLQLVQGLAERLSLGEVEFRPAAHRGLHPERCAEVWAAGEYRGLVGQLAAAASAELELRGTTVVAELRVDGWLVEGGRPGWGVKLSKTPALSVDLAVTVPERAELGPATAAVRSAAIAELEQIRLVDQYQGDQLPPGTKGWTFRLVFRHPERTLTHREGEQLRSRVLAALSGAVAAELRTGSA